MVHTYSKTSSKNILSEYKEEREREAMNHAAPIKKKKMQHPSASASLSAKVCVGATRSSNIHTWELARSTTCPINNGPEKQMENQRKTFRFRAFFDFGLHGSQAKVHTLFFFHPQEKRKFGLGLGH